MSRKKRKNKPAWKLNIDVIREKAAWGTTQPLRCKIRRADAKSTHIGLNPRLGHNPEAERAQAEFGQAMRERFHPNYNPGGPPW